MTPGARVQAAIDCLDAIARGAPAEQVLTGWARASRFAGSKDRAAVRDHVFDVLRRWRSAAALGGGESGRARMLGALRAGGADPAALFSGQGHAPAPLTAAERAGGRAPQGAEAADLPDWLWQQFLADLGAEAAEVAEALRSRAPVHLRVNAARVSRAAAQEALAGEGIETRPHPAAAHALEVTAGARGLRNARAYAEGWVELQDAGSQAVLETFPLRPGLRVLDYCAGGGGKSLALAAMGAEVVAHDANPLRLRDIPARAARAGVRIALAETADLPRLAPFDLVLCDVPCSGSGAWRRSPDAKWRLAPEDLDRLCAVQAGILAAAARLTGAGGVLGYVTCSVLTCENDAQVSRFLRSGAGAGAGWRLEQARRWRPGHGTDGFFAAHLTRE